MSRDTLNINGKQSSQVCEHSFLVFMSFTLASVQRLTWRSRAGSDCSFSGTILGRQLACALELRENVLYVAFSPMVYLASDSICYVRPDALRNRQSLPGRDQAESDMQE